MRLNPYFRKYPAYRDVLDHYKEMVSRFEKAGEIKAITNEGTYRRKIAFGDIPHNYAWLEWDVKKLVSIIEEKGIEKELLSTKALEKLIDKSSVQADKLDRALKRKEPIIAIHYKPIGVYFTVKGEHQVMARHLYGRNKGYEDVEVEGYILEEDDYVEALKSERDLVIYKVFSNLSKIYHYYKTKDERPIGEMEAGLFRI